MSYRKWMKKWQVVIFWVIALAFLGGVIWWSVGLYVSSRRSSNQGYTLDSALAYLTKDGSPINNPTYWIFPSEVRDRLNSYVQIYKMYYGRDMDQLFEEPLYEAMIIDSFMVEKVLIYYANNSEIKVTRDELEKELEKIRKQIESNEKYIQYVKSNYGSVDKYITTIKKNVELNLLADKVRKMVATVSSEEMKSYFDNHKNEIKEDYETASASMVILTDEATAQKLVELARKVGFDKAASELSLSPISYNINRKTFDEEITDKIFSSKPGDIIGPFSHLSSWVVLKIGSLNLINSYEDFLSSKAYDEVKKKLEDEKFKKWYESYLKKEEISLHINDEELSIWYEYSKHIKDKAKILEILKELKAVVFPDGKFDEGAPDLLKALYVVILEREENDLQNYKLYLLKDKLSDEEKKELEDLKKIYGDMKADDINKKLQTLRERKKTIVKFLYDNYSTSPGVLERAIKLFPDDPQVVYDYYHNQYQSVKPMLSYAKYDNRMIYTIAQIGMGLYSVYMSDKASSDLKFDAIYDVYEMYKLLGDATTASSVLSEMKKSFPNRLSYDVEFQELENMLSPSTPASE